MRLLDDINSPEDIRGFDSGQLEGLCREIRDYMLECCAVNPGHLGASLGAVELIVGLHYVYDTPKDKVIFDVGHQAYAHKILTGRKEEFRKNRKRDGISGFPRREESPYDAFGVGHASTSISAALGFAHAASILGSGDKVVALIGDGALTGGLAFEGLNNAGSSNSDILIILNDNNQSIDGNLGAFHDYLLKITTAPLYNKIKSHIWDKIGEGALRKMMQKMTKSTKSNLVRTSGGDLFESLGFRYFGPIDGNDIHQVTDTLRRLKGIKGPRILHAHTVKGKGYAPAEADPTTWHAPGRFDCRTGERLQPAGNADRYQDVFGQVLVELAEMDGRVLGITPAMATGCGMNLLAEQMPERFFDVGIEEEHAVTFSAGLAAAGMKPFCNIYSSFSQRAYDNIIHDVAIQNLPVVLCLDRGGLVGEDGDTHHGSFDMAAYRSIPNAVIAAPSDEVMLKNLMYTGLYIKGGPYIIRYPRGSGEGAPWRETACSEMPLGKGRLLRKGGKVAVLAMGPSAVHAAKAADRYAETVGEGPAVYDMVFLKPIDEEILEEAAGFEAIITIEDGAMKGGLFGAVAEYMAEKGHSVRILPLGIPDRFIPQDTREGQMRECGLDVSGILGKIGEAMQICRK